MARKRSEGAWKYSADRWETDDKDKERVRAHRKAMEKEHLTRLADAMRPLLDGFDVEFHAGDYGSFIEVSSYNLERVEAKVIFRYYTFGFGEKGEAEGISVKSDGVWNEISGLGRAYGYDFEKGCMKPAALKKMCKVISDHLNAHIRRKQNRAARRSDATTMGEQAKSILEPLGYTVEVKAKDAGAEVRISRGDTLIIEMNVTSSGFSASSRGYYGIDVYANPGNLAAVIQAVENLKNAMKEG